MIKFKKLVFACLLGLTQLLTAQVLPDSLRINDGSYVFIEGTQLIEKSIVDGAVQSRTLKENAYKTEFDREISTYTGIFKIVALSDVHGQVDLFKQILKSNKIINDDLNWSFGDGHMVIVGDVFDRGDKVTEVLWFLFQSKNRKQHRQEVACTT